MAGSPESAASVRGEYCNRMRIRVGIRAVIEKKLDDRHITGFSGGNDQGRVHVIGPRVNIGVVAEENARFGEIGGGPHERGGACVVLSVGVGAVLKEQLDSVGRAVNHCVHEGRRALRAASVEELRISHDLFIQSSKVAAAKTFHDRNGLGAQWGALGFV